MSAVVRILPANMAECVEHQRHLRKFRGACDLDLALNCNVPVEIHVLKSKIIGEGKRLNHERSSFSFVLLLRKR